jgi:hypothetical protein
MDAATAKQPAPTGNGADITDMVIQDLTIRRKIGTEKYGTALRAFNGRNAMVDAYQEVLDLTVYLRQRLAEDAERESGLAVTTHDVAGLGKEMRDKQKEYFRTRKPDVLEESKELERRFDAVVSQVLDPQLFSGLK